MRRFAIVIAAFAALLVAVTAADCAAAAACSKPTSTGDMLEVTSADQFSDHAWRTDMAFLIVFYADWSEHSLNVKRELEQAATHFGKSGAKHHDDVQFASVNGPLNEDLARNYSVHAFPEVFLFLYGHGIVPYAPHGHSVEEVVEFVNYQLDHHHSWKTKKADQTASNIANANNHDHPDLGHVVELTNETFDKISGDTAKAVFVMFYAPWCPHCTELVPTLRSLAEYYGQRARVVIARVDCQAEAKLCDRFHVNAFPMMRLFPQGAQGKRRGFSYKGERTLHGLQHFMDMYSGTPPPEEHDDFKMEEDHDDYH